MTPVQELLQNDVKLPSPPAIAVRILDLVRGDDFSFRELAKIIQTDPALTTRILRIANSAMYSLPNKVSNFETAISLLGGNTLKNIALSFIISQGFQGKRGDRFDFSRMWRRSVTAAVAGQLIAEEIHFKSDDLFITTLLQDIGIGAMYLCRQEDYLNVLNEKLVSGRPLTVVEKEVYGFDHQEVGYELLKMWGMPETVYAPIRHHHDVDIAPIELRKLCHVIRAADRLAAVYYGSESVRNVRRSKELLSNSFELSEDQVIRLIDAVAQKSGELLSQFNMPSGKMKTYSQILESANEELIRLNLSSESLIVELKEARKRAELLAAELKVANAKLRDKAFKDDLTGLYNHRYFLEILDIELESTRRFGHLLSLLMFDVDNFKGVNDTYGHRAGDEVLRTVGQYLNRSSRGADTAARYGGDEFVILLRGTNIEGARVRAEAIRSEISELKIDIDGKIIGVTVSIGIAFFDQRDVAQKNNFINMVDKAMYESKRGGRNRVSAGTATG